jgi:hypothetical protein
VPDLVEKLGLSNEFDVRDGDPPDAVAFLRRIGATPGDVEDDGLLAADAVVHVASGRPEPLAELGAALSGLLPPAVSLRVIRGAVLPTTYTGNAMHDLAYARQVTQRPGGTMPDAFLLPMNKSGAWWEKDWMERHTYFLPRYDRGERRSDGHVLTAAPGVDFLMRRTYQSLEHPAAPDEYDFVTYFECAADDVSRFHGLLAALRDVSRNPEWEFVREGPTWHGRRTATWRELFDGEAP